jgi:hypothetical protein
MTKAELIERYGIEWYEEYKARKNAEYKERYKNDAKFRASKLESSKEYQKDKLKNDPKFRVYQKEYQMNDLNSVGKTKLNIRSMSYYILFKQRSHTKLNGYEIHHCFGYDDPSKFIYIPKSLHTKIHQYLRDNNINADSNHYIYISTIINECTDYTYISA